MKTYALFWFDVEDYITYESDDALMGLLDIFEVQGVQATWKVVGEKARSLQERQRRDIIRLLQSQDLGYHTDTHSQHPVLAEYLEHLGWEDGIAEAARRETPGYEDLCRIIGPSSTFGQAGGSWAPHIAPLMRRWDIPLFMDEAGHIGLDGGPFWYGGVLHVNRLEERCTRMAFEAGAAGLEAGNKAFDALAAKGGLVSIYYHPCEFATHAFWDGVNFANGANPPSNQWRQAPIRTPDERRQGLAYFASYLRHIRQSPETEILSGRQLIGLLPDLAAGQAYSAKQIAAWTAFADGGISYTTTDELTLSPAELFHLTVHTLTALVDGDATDQVLASPDGPTRRVVSSLPEGTSLNANALLNACRDLRDFLAIHLRLPDAVHLGVERLSPADFLLSAADLLRTRLVRGSFPDSVSLRRGQLALEHHVRADSWDWPIFPAGFKGERLIELARLQTWTLKPALLRP
jgi:hypothetical protein